MRKKIVLLDLGNVLFHFDPATRLAALSGTTGLPESVIAQQIQESDIIARLDAGQAHDHDLVVFMSGLADRQMRSEECWRIWFSVFSPNPAVWETLPTLAQTYRLGVLSNNPSQMRSMLTAHGTVLDATDIFLSGEIGITKPSAALYALVQQRLAADGSDVMLVDDSKRNLDAAAEFNWRTIQYEPNTVDSGASLLKQVDETFHP